MIDRTRTRLIRSSFRDRAEGVAAAAAILRELRAEATPEKAAAPHRCRPRHAS